MRRILRFAVLALLSLGSAGFAAAVPASHVSDSFPITNVRVFNGSEVIPAATVVVRGRIAPGLRADLLLVQGDPTVNIKSTRKIQRIWKAGVEVERELPAPPHGH